MVRLRVMMSPVRLTLGSQKTYKVRNDDPRIKKRVKAVFDFNPLLPKISTVLKKHHRTMLSDNPELRDSLPEPPMAYSDARAAAACMDVFSKFSFYIKGRWNRLVTIASG